MAAVLSHIFQGGSSGSSSTENSSTGKLRRVSQHEGSITRTCGSCGDQGRKFWPPLLRERIPFEELTHCDADVALTAVARSHRSHQSQRRSDSVPINHVGLFREPRARLVSAFNHNKHSFGIGPARPVFVESVQTLEDYVNTPAIKSCTTKMLIGKMCATPVNITASDRSLALSNLRGFAFVGLTEAFNASVCLFHHMHGGPVFPFEFAYVREAAPYQANETFRLPGGSRRADPKSWSVIVQRLRGWPVFVNIFLVCVYHLFAEQSI